jgi:hypothetical protein
VTRKAGLVLTDFLYTLVTKCQGEEAGSSRWGGGQGGRAGYIASWDGGDDDDDDDDDACSKREI